MEVGEVKFQWLRGMAGVPWLNNDDIYFGTDSTKRGEVATYRDLTELLKGSIARRTKSSMIEGVDPACFWDDRFAFAGVGEYPGDQ